MEREDSGRPLHTEADNEKPLDSEEAAVMGAQAVRRLRGIPKDRETVYGDVDEGYDNEDQADANQAGPGEHV